MQPYNIFGVKVQRATRTYLIIYVSMVRFTVWSRNYVDNILYYRETSGGIIYI